MSLKEHDSMKHQYREYIVALFGDTKPKQWMILGAAKHLTVMFPDLDDDDAYEFIKEYIHDYYDKLPKTEEEVPLVPALKDTKKANEFSNAIEEKNHAAFQCFMLLNSLIDIRNKGIKTVTNGFIVDAKHWTDRCRIANERSLKIISGR